jgi:hypothetical protein
MRLRLRTLLPLAALLVVGGCANIGGVKPWQRDLLSREEMSPQSEPLDRRFDDHLYDCKEGTSGGRSLGAENFRCH